MFRLHLPEQALKSLRHHGEILVVRSPEEGPDWKQGQAVLGLFERPQNAAQPIWLTISRDVETKPWFQLTDEELQAGGEYASQTFLDNLGQNPDPEKKVLLLWIQKQDASG